MTINAILAHDEEYGIGLKNELPWPRSDADMKWFQDCTKGHVVVMGRRTWESLGNKKLPNRINVVVTRSKLSGGTPDKVCAGSLSEILHSLKLEYPHLKIWVIGGAEIYKQAIPICDNLYTTQFKGVFEADTHMDVSSYLKGFTLLARKHNEDLTFSIWSRI